MAELDGLSPGDLARIVSGLDLLPGRGRRIDQAARWSYWQRERIARMQSSIALMSKTELIAGQVSAPLASLFNATYLAHTRGFDVWPDIFDPAAVAALASDPAFQGQFQIGWSGAFVGVGVLATLTALKFPGGTPLSSSPAVTTFGMSFTGGFLAAQVRIALEGLGGT